MTQVENEGKPIARHGRDCSQVTITRKGAVYHENKSTWPVSVSVGCCFEDEDGLQLQARLVREGRLIAVGSS